MLFNVFQPRSSLPIPQQKGIGEQATTEANAAVAEANTTVAAVIGDSHNTYIKIA